MGNYRYNRYSIRLAGYDYSQSGYYFITLVTQYREKQFGINQNKKMKLNDIGRMIKFEWNQIPKRFKNVILDQYIIMPDHFHGIVQIISNKNQPFYDKNNVGMPLVGIHPEKLPIYDKSPFVKNNDINTGLQNHICGSQGVCNKIQNIYNGSQRTETSPVPAGKTTLFDIICAFKSITTNMYINGVKLYNWPRFNKRLWQLRYYDRIIRNKNELDRIRDYIIANPIKYHSRTK